MQKSTKTLLFLIVLYLLALQRADCGSSAPIWVASSYFKAGAVTFAFTSGATLQNATITYSSSMVNSNLKVPTLGITDIDFLISSGKIYLLIQVVQYTATLLKFQVQVATSSSLSLLKMTYMALDNSFTPPFSMNYFFPSLNQNATGISAQFYVNFTASTGVTLNTSHENVLLPFMHYINVITYDNTIDINLSFTVLNSSYYTVVISSTSKIYFQYAGFSRLIFDKTAIEAMGNDYFNYGMISSTNNNNAGLSTIIPPNIIPSNLFYGMHSFTITTGLSVLSYTSAYVINTGVIGYTSKSPYVYSKMQFSYIHHKTRTCPAAYPFYNIALVLCYDICPIRWYGNVSSSTCEQCLYDCYTCTNSSTCSSCNATTDFRTLSGSRCVPISGYFQTNSTVAGGCSSPCVTCQNSATGCSTCISGYYASNSACLTCVASLPNCITCNSSSFCTQCSDGSSGSSCSSCTYGQYPQSSNSTCVDCSSVIPLCVACTAANACTLCQPTFTLFGPTNCSCNGFEYRYQTEGSLTCFPCADTIPYCFSCTTSTDCSGCYSTFILSADGTSCNCNANSFINSSSRCQTCSTAIPYCITCTSSTQCTLCQATFAIINGTCQCDSGYYFDSGSSSCLSCPSAISQCVTCSSSAVCLTCDSGYQINSTTHACDLILCIINNCYECITGNYTICQYCNTGYSLGTANSSCRVVCGDYQLHNLTEQCDDGNTASGDGCSSTCQIETGFSCASQYVNVTQTYSSCFYSGTISFELLWTRKIEGVNQLKFLFQLKQKINQWNTVDFTSISAVDFVDTSTNFTLGMTQDFVQSCSTSYDSTNNRFSLTITYFNYSLEKQWISVALSPYSMGYPAFTPPSNVEFFPPTSSLIFSVLANNNQNSNLYSSAFYGMYTANTVITYVVLALAVFTIGTSLVFRKGTLLTFEMLTIIQISYFSVAFLDSMNPAFAAMLPLRYLTGVLNFQFIENYLYEFTSVDAMKGIYIYLNLSSNFNVVAMVLAIFLALGFVLLLIHFIVSYCAKSKDKSKEVQPGGYWMQRVAYHFIGELSIALVLAWLPLFTISLFFELLYTKSSSNFWSYTLAVGVGIAIVAYFIALVKTPYLKEGQFSRLGEYISEFNPVSSLFGTFKYPNLQMMQTCLISALVMLCIYANTKLFCTMCIIFICFVDIILVAIVQPYRYGFVSCFRGEDNDTEVLFEKIQLYKVYEKELPPVHTDVAEMSRKAQLEQNASEVFTQHFVTRKNVIKTKHQGLIKAGEVLNHSRLILFNNNFRRIINLSSLILVEFVFVCAKLFETQINQSSDSVTIKMMLPLFIHLVLFLNMSYNYTFLVLQILDRTKQNMNLNRVDENPDSSSQFMKSIYTNNAIKKEEAVEAEAEESAAAPIKTHHEIVQENATTKSMYNLKRPQILHPTRKAGTKRTVKKMQEHIEE